MNVVLAEELVQFDVLRVQPPLLPLFSYDVVAVGVSLCDGDVANTSIEPNVKHFSSILLGIEALDVGNWHAPAEISCDGAWVEAFVKP